MIREENVLEKGTVLAVFTDWKGGYTAGNAVIISETLARRSDFASLFTERFRVQGRITQDVPTASEADLFHLDDNGVVKIGTVVKAGDILIGRVAPKSEGKLTDDEKVLRAIFGDKIKEFEDTSCRMNLQDGAIVTDARYLPTIDTAEVDILIARDLRVGDILDWSGEGKPQFVVSAILPEDQMPWIPRFHKRAEIVINQTLVKGFKFDESIVRFNDGLRKRKKVARIQLRKIPMLYEEKIQARSTGSYHIVTGQPLNDPANWIQGARVAKSDLSWLMSAGCESVVEELLTFKSSSREAFEIYNALVRRARLILPTAAPGVLKVILKILQSLAVSIYVEENHLRLEFANDDAIRSWSYGEVTCSETLHYITGKPARDGLFCQKIFGPTENFCCACGKYSRVRYRGVICEKCGVEVVTTSVRKERMGHIALASPVTHPLARHILLNVLPVLPPDLRPMIAREGKFLTDDLNGLYRNVINRNRRLRILLEISAPEQIIRLEKKLLQESVNKLFGTGPADKLHTLLKFAENTIHSLWQKRVDYSGEGIVVPNPDIEELQCGLPKKMALEIFKPIVMAALVQKMLTHSIKSAKRLIDDQAPEAYELLQTLMMPYLILVGKQGENTSYAGLMPIMVEGEAIQLNPKTCADLGLKLYGDKIAVHLPLSRKAQIDAQSIILPYIPPNQPITLQSAFLLEEKTLSAFLSTMGAEGKTIPLSLVDKLMLGKTLH